jgi:hypothetical protein
LGLELTREIHNHLREIHLKLDSLKREQERLLSRMVGLDRASDTQISKLNELHTRLSSKA